VLWLLIRIGMPPEPVNEGVIRTLDLPGLLYLGIGASLAYAALDQGDRLDWLGSGVITGLFAGAAVCLVAFVWREATTATPFFNFGFVRRGNLPLLAALLVLFRFEVLATALVVPQFLTIVQGYRALEVGDALIWIALPQFVFAPLVAQTLRHIDARYVMMVGFATIGVACLLVANGMTRDWVSGDFVPSQLVQALGQSCALTGFISCRPSVCLALSLASGS
jgi:DHA2 family multidrug resistance protein